MIRRPFDLEDDSPDPDELSAEDSFLLDMGLTPDGDRVSHTYIRPDTGFEWHPDDDEGAPPFGR